jgi:pyruvate formate lyase activating enzyme
MKEALYYKKLKDKVAQCQLCPRKCVVKNGSRGDCRVRVNKDGKFYSIVYGRPCSVAVDPIEKKPLFHFLPGSKVYSIGTAGCNSHCKACQNFAIAQVDPGKVSSINMSPSDVVKQALEHGCSGIAYTYNDPVVFYEYVLDTAKLAHKKGLKNILVTNGFINKEPLERLCKVIDAVNVDLKGINNKFYRKYTLTWIEPVLESIRTLVRKKVWVEITNLVIPGVNDSDSEIEDLCKWVSQSFGRKIPLHFSRFFPCYKLEHLEETPIDTLERAREIGLKYLDFVYIGNLSKEENTYCPSCGTLMIKRRGFNVLDKKRRCCDKEIEGVWT